MRLRRRRSGTRRKVRYVAVIPSLITLGNGVCGILALEELLKPAPDVLFAAWLILLGILLDGLDGFVARATRSPSAFGAQLDSLCDAVTFGVVPALLMLKIVGSMEPLPPLMTRGLVAVSVIYGVCALIRLARFNVESVGAAGHRDFAGLPSPAAGGMLASIILAHHTLLDSPGWTAFGEAALREGMPLLTLFLALLMVSRVPYPHFLSRTLRGFRPFTRLIELVLAIVLVVILHQVAIFVGFFVYTVSGPVLVFRSRLVCRSRRRPSTDVEHESLH